MPYIRVIHTALHPSYELVEHKCEGCGEIFQDNSRSTKRCDNCKAIEKNRRNKSTKKKQNKS